ncbi:hypothetical protein [Halobaculum marinum]|uniref:Ig-like domain-containing protein n=1 Tax=Halobaculum marinum TaxID=3031996 RepID=A0ABD5WTA8_9EURY|nr:hypothetical protein [Halobaculum sp. DT55]
MKRRGFLAAAAALASAGCVARGPAGTPSPTVTGAGANPAKHLGEFVLWNDHTEAQRLSVTVRGGGETVVDVERHLDPGEVERVDNLMTRQGTYEVVATLPDGPRDRLTWEITSCGNYEYVRAHVTEDRDVTVEVGTQTVVPPPECE